MFSPEEFSSVYSLHENYRSQNLSEELLTPRIIELLDTQTVLASGTVYMSSLKKAGEYFASFTPSISGTPLLIVSDADQAPVFVPEGLMYLAYEEGLGRLHNCMSAYIDLSGSVFDFQEFGNAWREIMGNRNLTTSEVWDILKKIKYLTKPFVMLGVVNFEEDRSVSAPLRLIAKQLQALIPHCAVTVYNKEIVLFITYEDRRFDLPFDVAAVTPILDKYNGHLALSNGTRDLTALSTLYALTRRMIIIATSLQLIPKERVYTFERLGMYLIVDLCANGVPTFWQNDFVMYLAHPVIVAIARHDKDSGDNLLHVLYFYLSTNCSVSETAELMHMHRNTIMNKVRKITDTFKLDLTDRHLRQRLLFSEQIYMYQEKLNRLKPL